MKLVSWNVNGIRAASTKGFYKFIEEENPDIICLQETKIDEPHKDLTLLTYPYHYWCHAVKKGYSGTAIFSKIKPVQVTCGMDIKEHDQEGRVQTAEFEKFYLVNVYTPNSQRGLTRLSYRREWNKEFLAYLKKLEKKKPVIFCGDLNVAHKEIDIANPKSNRKNAGFTDEERADFDAIVAHGFVDTFREFNKEPNQYSWWTYMFNARERNIGWRIDYFCISKSLRPILKDAFIRQKALGSDHCPVGIVLETK